MRRKFGARTMLQYLECNLLLLGTEHDWTAEFLGSALRLGYSGERFGVLTNFAVDVAEHLAVQGGRFASFGMGILRTDGVHLDVGTASSYKLLVQIDT